VHRCTRERLFALAAEGIDVGPEGRLARWNRAVATTIVARFAVDREEAMEPAELELESLR
jgi:hypothetical protein